MKRILSSLYLLLISIALLANDRFDVSDIFTDHMVLQRNANVKVWGEGTDGSQIEVRFEGQNRKTVVAKGKWTVDLKTGEAGGPYKLEIVNGNHKICFKDVFVGDVWLAGGQSNMEFALRRVKDAQAERSARYITTAYEGKELNFKRPPNSNPAIIITPPPSIN